jgi:hypothetical protein
MSGWHVYRNRKGKREIRKNAGLIVRAGKGGETMKNIVRIIMICCALTTHFALSGCGSGGSGGAQNAGVSFPPASLSSSPAVSAENSYSLTEDTYGLQNATFMSANGSNGSFVLRAAIANNMTDPNFTTVFRIDIQQPSSISGNRTYSIGGNNASGPLFPGDILFFNGHKSSLLNTISGTVTFTSYGTNSGDVVSGSFAVLVEDQNSATRPVYSVKGNFTFVLNTYGVLVPTPSPVPAAASGEYNTKCASCHALGGYDPSSTGGAPDLALKGGEIAGKFTAGVAGHNNITLSASEISDLKVLLNAN